MLRAIEISPDGTATPVLDDGADPTPDDLAALSAAQEAWLAVGTLPARIPAFVTMRQARLALLGAGMLAQVNAAVAAMTGVQGDAARIEWEYSQEVQRGKALVQALGPALGLSAAQLDALFVAAKAL